ncbi:MAG: hypothetical protein H0T43_05280, partial [Solirubrobacterales bacterium]|nr:hypothetical protein [Solirubrobacterales bacterium]
MGTVVSLEGHRRERLRRNLVAPGGCPRATFFFDLSSPFTYLAAERADRLFASLIWRPACAAALHAGEPAADDVRRAAA